MKNNKKYILILLAICAASLIGGVIFFFRSNPVVDENAVSRYEWIEMLGERLGVNEYVNESPYFRDVDSGNPYFAYIQSAVEGKVLDVSSDFDGEKYASGKFIIVTAMKTLGESKVRIYLNTDNAITDDTYIELAMEHGLIEKEKLKKGFSKEECEQVLETLYSLYFSEFWKDDYSSIVYQDGVIELHSTDIVQSNMDGSRIAVTDNVLHSCEIGDIIVFEQKNTKLKLARKIAEISADGTLSLKTAELDEVVKSLIVSDIKELTFEDIIDYYELGENTDSVNDSAHQQPDARLMNTAILSGDIDSKGYKLSLSTKDEDDEKYLEVRITDNDTGEFYLLPINTKINPDDEYSAEINIDKIYIGGQIDFSWGGVKYAEAAVDAHATFSGNIETEKEKKIHLFQTPAPLGNGVVGADIQIFLVLSVDGSISFSAELPVEVSVSYEEGRGVRNFEHHISVEEPKLEVNCSASAMIRIEPTFVIFGCLNVMDVEADIGISASAQMALHPNLQECADISVSFPVLTVSICGDDDADTIVGKLELSKEWEILTPENAPKQFGFHYELLPDGTIQFVDECTYKELQEDFISDGVPEYFEFNVYEQPVSLWINSPFEDVGEYYTVKGNLRIDYSVSCKDFDTMQKGDHFTILDKEFILGEQLETEEFPAEIYPVYDVKYDCIYYIQTEVSLDFGSGFGEAYYPICRSIPDYDAIIESMDFLSSDLERGKIKIAKDTRITSLMEISESAYAAKTDTEESEYTAKECFEDHVLIDDWLDIVNFSSVYGKIDPPLICYVILDENGAIDTIVWNSFG